jgi:hypothetical protein
MSNDLIYKAAKRGSIHYVEAAAVSAAANGSGSGGGLGATRSNRNSSDSSSSSKKFKDQLLKLQQRQQAFLDASSQLQPLSSSGWCSSSGGHGGLLGRKRAFVADESIFGDDLSQFEDYDDVVVMSHAISSLVSHVFVALCLRKGEFFFIFYIQLML